MKNRKLINNQKNRRTRFIMQLGFLLNLRVHPKPPSETKRKPYLKTRGPNKRKKYPSLHKGRIFLKGN
jgi:hypothetical protein